MSQLFGLYLLILLIVFCSMSQLVFFQKIVMYSLTPHGHYHMQKWLCNADIAATGIPLPPSRNNGASSECYAATNAVAYNDGSTFSMACTCCDTSCNGAADFCRFHGSLAACIGVRNNIPKTAYQQPNVELVILTNGTIAINVTDPEDSGVRTRSGNDADLSMTQSGGCSEANDKHHEKKSVVLVLILLLTWNFE